MFRRAIALRTSRMLALMALVIASSLALPFAATAYAPIESAEKGEMPTTGGLRPGPLGLNPDPYSILGVQPVAIRIEKAAVDATIEVQEIVEGVMLNPSGPFVVSWYRETGRLGALDNIVLAGHLDYWDVGEAVFYNLGRLEEGDVIEITGEDDVVYKYEVEWVKSYQVADLDTKELRNIVGKTDSETLTLITCGGTFDYNQGEYLERMIVRAHRV
ncbi:MAG: class F sortase, partial [Thermomicrobiales bacterium]|nr:class F sortase [Thermomicrobiales bacterium]